MNIKENILHINERIARAKGSSPISAPKVTLLAASKMQGQGAIEEAIRAGITCFGENRVQEAHEKWLGAWGLGLREKVQLHLIGALQTNKVRQALELFDVIQTLDREKLAKAISLEFRVLSAEKKEENTQNSALKTQHFYIQVNTGEEPQKSGVLPKDADGFIKYCIDDLKLPVVGLMCVPPADQPPAPHFALLREIALRHNLDELSMGMSGDFETAIRMGASCVRVGSGIFGERVA